MKDWEPENKRKIRRKMKLEEEKKQKFEMMKEGQEDERKNATKRMTNST